MRQLTNRLEGVGIVFGLIIFALWFYSFVLLDYTVGWFLGIRMDFDLENPSGRARWSYKTKISQAYSEDSCGQRNRLAPWEIVVPLVLSVWFLASYNRLIGTGAVVSMLAAAFSFTMTAPVKTAEQSSSRPSAGIGPSRDA